MSVPGRVVIAPRAVRGTAVALTAEAFGAAPSAVRAELVEQGAALGVRLTTPIVASATPMLVEAARRRDVVRDRLGELTGARVGTVEVRLRGLVEARPTRVR